MRALLLENIHTDAVERLKHGGYDVETVATALDEATLIEKLKGVSVLGIRSKTQVTEAVLDSASDLLAIGAFCIGTDQIDLEEASARGIAAFNAPYSNTRSVVELAMAEIISMARRLTEKNQQMHEGEWNKSASGAHEIRGRVLGIVGYGNIGSQLSVIAEALGMRVLFYDIGDKLALGNAQRCNTLDELLSRAEVVSLHVDGRRSNASFFGDAEFQKMQPRSLFLNLCRGFVIDHESLAKHLKSGHIAGAAIDVFPDEPAGKTTEFVSPLRGIPNVILTPHIGGSTEEAQADIGHFVSNKLATFVSSGSTSLSVNMPSVAPPHATEVRRIAHLHKNVPGVMAEFNSVLASCGVNVDGQLLGTRGDFGYALTDVSVDVPAEAIEKLNELDATVKLRII